MTNSESASPAASKEATLKLWMREIRIHQWLKNLLIFVPLLASHRIRDPSVLVLAVIAYLLFGCCASSAYVLNDLVDLRHDRHHPYKSRRPFAAGSLSVRAPD